MSIDTNPSQKRLLALDIGSKRIGLAIWNPKARLAEPIDLRRRKTLAEDLKFLNALIGEREIEALLVGIPLTLGEKESESTKNARFWVDTLKSKLGLPVYEWDESLSSRDADDLMRLTTKKSKQKDKRDSIAAALFLEEFIRGLADSSKN